MANGTRATVIRALRSCSGLVMCGQSFPGTVGRDSGVAGPAKWVLS